MKRIRGAAESGWDDLRKVERKTDALSAQKGKFPARYQQLVEQYTRDLQEGDDSEE